MSGLTRIRPIIENLIIAQRALGRAISAKDKGGRETALDERDRCASAIDDAFRALELAHAFAVQEQQRLAARESNLRHVLTILKQRDPAAVGQAIDAALVKLDEDQRFNEGFLTRLGEAIEDGSAIRRGKEVRITFAGVQELVSAKRYRFDLESARAEIFKLEQRMRADERATSIESISPTNNQPRKAAAGA